MGGFKGSEVVAKSYHRAGVWRRWEGGRGAGESFFINIRSGFEGPEGLGRFTEGVLGESWGVVGWGFCPYFVLDSRFVEGPRGWRERILC